MSYHPNPAINGAVLAIINDGDGSMCGMSYKERCIPGIVENGIGHYRNAVRTYSKRYAASPLTFKEQIEAADLLQAYYRQHIKEFNP